MGQMKYRYPEMCEFLLHDTETREFPFVPIQLEVQISRRRSAPFQPPANLSLGNKALILG